MVQREGRVDGQICVVTGGNAGIGLATATALARLGGQVALVSRDPDRGEAARGEIVAAYPDARVRVHQADLSRQGEVRRLAGELGDRYGRVDVLVNNAAAYTRRRTETPDGIETQWAVNHLAPYLLTRLLLPALAAAGTARVVTLSSEAHRATSMRWDDLEGRRRYNGLFAYAQSKLANLLFSQELARRALGQGTVANAAHPGVIGTQLLFGGFAPLRLLRRFLKTPEQGARTPVQLASSPDVEGVTGGYWRDEHPLDPSHAARDPDSARRLWELSAGAVGLD